MIRKIVYSVLMAILSLALAGCFHGSSDKGKKKSIQVITVKSLPTYTTLFFAGNLTPHREDNIITPIAGVVVDQGFRYGQRVKAGQLLYKIKSDKERNTFQSALSGYLKAKETLSSSQGKLQSTKSLFTKGLVSTDEYTQTKNSFYLNELSMLQAQHQLKTAMKYYDPGINVFSLTIADIKSINEALSLSKKGGEITIKSPAEGVALFPTQKQGGGGGSGGSGKVTQGVSVKAGQVLVTIGRLAGLAMKGTVNEIDINKVKAGMKATVTSVAFPDLLLHGLISEVDAQATSSGNLPVFNLRIVIPKVSKKAAKIIKVGMSAKAEVKIKEKPQMRIPINAVTQNPKTQQSMVTLLVKGKQKATPIVTGTTTLSTVIVESGLKPGDKIVISH
jgi:HlyD family secretion protein